MKEKRNFRVVIGENLQYLRRKYALTQADLAEKLEISISHIANIERAESSVSISLLQKITELFEITPNDLLLENIATINKNKKTAEEEFREGISDKMIALGNSLYFDFIEFNKKRTKEGIMLSSKTKSESKNKKSNYKIKHNTKADAKLVADKECKK